MSSSLSARVVIALPPARACPGQASVLPAPPVIGRVIPGCQLRGPAGAGALADVSRQPAVSCYNDGNYYSYDARNVVAATPRPSGKRRGGSAMSRTVTRLAGLLAAVGVLLGGCAPAE